MTAGATSTRLRQDGAVIPGHEDDLHVVRRTLDDAVRVHEQLHDEAELIVRAAELCRATLAAGGTVLVFGNGGSAAEAQHFATELSGRFLHERRALAALALTTDSSALTAIANDYGFERVFERQIEALGRPGDVAIAISTSGSSPNVVCGLQAARARGLKTIAVTGPGVGPLGDAADVCIPVPGGQTPRVQEGQLTVLHLICDLVERDVVRTSRR
jgi:D-sedoheptulose 7-phosphate isomerase